MPPQPQPISNTSMSGLRQELGGDVALLGLLRGLEAHPTGR